METNAATSFKTPTAVSSDAAQAEATATKKDTINLSADFEMFLTLLTTQMQNQDPLNPVDSTEYATQLASFSAVEQQIKTNELLEQMMGKTGGGALQQYGGWIGKEVLVEAPVRFEGKPIMLRPDVHAEATSAYVSVTGPSGAIVERLQIPVDGESVVWSGHASDGSSYPAGVYRFDVESFAGDELLESGISPVYSRVEEIRSEGNSVKLRLSDGSETTVAMVQGLRNPSE